MIGIWVLSGVFYKLLRPTSKKVQWNEIINCESTISKKASDIDTKLTMTFGHFHIFVTVPLRPPHDIVVVVDGTWKDVMGKNMTSDIFCCYLCCESTLWFRVVQYDTSRFPFAPYSNVLQSSGCFVISLLSRQLHYENWTISLFVAYLKLLTGSCCSPFFHFSYKLPTFG